MTVWSTVFLAAIAAATVLMAVIQVGAIVYAARLARRVDRLADRIEREIEPIFASVRAISQDAARTAALALTQAERADRLFADFARRAEQTMAVVQNVLVTPAREGVALMAGARAVAAALWQWRDRGVRRGRGEEDDALFI